MHKLLFNLFFIIVLVIGCSTTDSTTGSGGGDDAAISLIGTWINTHSGSKTCEDGGCSAIEFEEEASGCRNYFTFNADYTLSLYGCCDGTGIESSEGTWSSNSQDASSFQISFGSITMNVDSNQFVLTQDGCTENGNGCMKSKWREGTPDCSSCTEACQ